MGSSSKQPPKWCLVKDFKISQPTMPPIRAEVFNLWNHTNWQSIATKLETRGFSQSVRNRDPRQMQFEARFTL